MKATEQYFPVVLFIMLYNLVKTFGTVDEILWPDHSNELPRQQYFHLLLFIFKYFLQNEIWDLSRILIIGALGSERVNKRPLPHTQLTNLGYTISLLKTFGRCFNIWLNQSIHAGVISSI